MLPKRSKGGGRKEGLICGGMNGTPPLILLSDCHILFFAWHRPHPPPIRASDLPQNLFRLITVYLLTILQRSPPFHAGASPDPRDGLRSSVMLTQNSVPLTAFLQRATAVKLAACFHPPTPDSPSMRTWFPCI